MDRQQPHAAARIMLRPIGTPLPLGLLALGGASIVVSGMQLKWLPVGSSHQVALVILAFTVPAQLLAAVFGFLSRDPVGGTGMSVLGGTCRMIVVQSTVSANSLAWCLANLLATPRQYSLFRKLWRKADDLVSPADHGGS